MSVEGIRSIIRRHTGRFPREPGMIPHAEVEAMITSARDGGNVTPRERAELLAAVAMFGSTAHETLLSQPDEEDLKQEVLRDIDTLERFQRKDRNFQTAFLSRCLFLGASRLLGFSVEYMKSTELPPQLQEVIEKIVRAKEPELAENGIQPADNMFVNVFSRNNEAYGYQLIASYPAKDRSGYMYLEVALSAGGLFHKQIAFDWDVDED